MLQFIYKIGLRSNLRPSQRLIISLRKDLFYESALRVKVQRVFGDCLKVLHVLSMCSSINTSTQFHSIQTQSGTLNQSMTNTWQRTACAPNCTISLSRPQWEATCERASDSSIIHSTTQRPHFGANSCLL